MYQITDQWQNNNRASHYGDGVFTTMAVCEGKIALLDYHKNRMCNDTQTIGLPIPDITIWNSASDRALALNNGVLKLILTAGCGGRGYQRPDTLHPTAHFFTSAIPTSYANWQQQGMSVTISELKMGLQPLLAGVKHLNRLEQTLIKQQLSNSAFDDALVFDLNEHLIEASSSNVFILDKNNHWKTPNITTSGVSGVKRKWVIDRANELGITINVCNISFEDMITAHSIMLTNALMHLIPVKMLTTRDKEILFDISSVQHFSSTLGR